MVGQILTFWDVELPDLSNRRPIAIPFCTVCWSDIRHNLTCEPRPGMLFKYVDGSPFVYDHLYVVRDCEWYDWTNRKTGETHRLLSVKIRSLDGDASGYFTAKLAPLEPWPCRKG